MEQANDDKDIVTGMVTEEFPGLGIKRLALYYEGKLMWSLNIPWVTDIN